MNFIGARNLSVEKPFPPPFLFLSISLSLARSLARSSYPLPQRVYFMYSLYIMRKI